MLIGEVSRRSGVSARMLRHYESLGLINPNGRTSGEYRDYSAEDIGRIFHIEGLRALGLSLSEIGRMLEDPTFDAEGLVADLISRSRRRIAEEQRLLERLEEVHELRHADGESLLRTIDLMRSLGSGDVIQRHKAALGSGAEGRLPVAALADAVLRETVPNAAGAMRWALAKAGERAVDHLVAGMSEGSDVRIRRNAVLALDEVRRHGDLAPAALKRVLDALAAGLGDRDAKVRSSIALILGHLGEPLAVDELLRMALSGPKDIEAAEALADLAATGPGSDSTSGDGVIATITAALRRAVDSPDSAQRFRALQVLMEMPEAFADIAALLARLGRDPDRRIAATARAELDRRAERARRAQ